MQNFQSINKGYNSVFNSGELSVGVVVPIENYAHSPIPRLDAHLQRAQLLEKLGFKALWLRDVPFTVPSFGDSGQLYDPFTYLGYLAAQTSEIALGISSIALPLRHPAHVAKSAATIDHLSHGRLILGVASGDRPTEYPAMNIPFDRRGDRFKDAFNYIRSLQESFPSLQGNQFGNLNRDVDVLPKAVGRKIPLLITGYSQQSLAWNSENGDGWMYYPRNLQTQKYTIEQWRSLIPANQSSKPFMQPLYIDLDSNNDLKPSPIHLGFRLGVHYLKEYFNHLKEIGVNHVAINLRFNARDIEKTLELIANEVLPEFHTDI